MLIAVILSVYGIGNAWMTAMLNLIGNLCLPIRSCKLTYLCSIRVHFHLSSLVLMLKPSKFSDGN